MPLQCTCDLHRWTLKLLHHPAQNWTIRICHRDDLPSDSEQTDLCDLFRDSSRSADNKLVQLSDACHTVIPVTWRKIGVDVLQFAQRRVIHTCRQLLCNCCRQRWHQLTCRWQLTGLQTVAQQKSCYNTNKTRKCGNWRCIATEGRPTRCHSSLKMVFGALLTLLNISLVDLLTLLHVFSFYYYFFDVINTNEWIRTTQVLNTLI